MLQTTETLHDEQMDEARPKKNLILAILQSFENALALLHRGSMESIAEKPNNDVIRALEEGRTLAMELESMITPYQEDTRSEVNIPNRLNQMNTTRIKPFQHNYEVYDDNILYTEQALDWDGKYVEVDEPFNLEKWKKDVQPFLFPGINYRRMVEPLDISGYYAVQKRIVRKCFFIMKKYGIKKFVKIDDWDGKMTSKLQDKSTCCIPNMYVELDELFNQVKRKKAVQRVSSSVMNYRRMVEPLNIPGKYVEVGEPFNLEKRKKAVQRVSSFVIVTTEFLWIITDICGQLSPIQLPQNHGSLLIWSSLFEILSFVAFVCAILAMIVVGARFSHLQRIMLMFWAIWMQVKSAKSLTAVSPPILGILFTGWHVLMEKQPPHEE